MSQENKSPVFAERLKSARKMAGLSMEELSKKANGAVTKQAISKYEQGRIKPSSTVLIELSRALGVKPEYFYRSSKISFSKMQFRTRGKLTVKQIESLKQRTIDFLERYLELENLVGIHIKFRRPGRNIAIHSYEDVEKIAVELRKNWQLGLAPIHNLLELLEENGIKVFTVENTPNFDGLSACIEGLHVIVINRDLPIDRIRFTAAHELAHILCEFSENSPHEALCHEFAGAFLLPRKILERELMKKRDRITRWELEEIKKLYGISMQAIVKRAHILGIVSDQFYRNFKAMLVKNNWKIEEPVAYEIKEKPIRFRQLLHYAVSEEIISLSRGAELAGKSLSEFQEEVRTAV